MVLRLVFPWMLNVIVVECSSARTVEGTIFGGVTAESHAFPYSVYLGVQCENLDPEEQKEFWVCGASILTQRVLLTAAHCMACKDIDFLIKLGHANETKGIGVKHSEHKIHHQYNEEQLYNDIGLISLMSDLQLGPNIRRVALLNDPPLNFSAVITGWGLTNDSNLHPERVLRYISQDIIDDEQCIQILKNKPLRTLCARNSLNLGHAHMGDSGGALVIQNYIQIGIVSYRVPDIEPTLGVYTATADYIGWIRSSVYYLKCNRKK